MSVTIDYERVREILEQNPPLDGYTSYYRQYTPGYKLLGPLAPDTQQVLQGAFSTWMHVLDVGCGRGDTLLDSAPLFRWGTGVDESADVMIATAEEARARRGIRNVDFRVGKAVPLPVDDETVDLVFSERGPLGPSDGTLREALRVLRPKGLIFVETIGELASWETRAAFVATYEKPTTLTAVLDATRDSFERHGVAIQTLANRVQTLQFPDIYEWLRYQCYTWCYPGRELLSAERTGELERLVAIAADDEGRINLTHHTVWIGGTKGS
ncbi:MAG: class I SAM-dependent methyltransferase [Planctomycetota bacterium]|jgi:ubiquinone/menaquinone biosynthesis C-methylase UbiE